MKNRFFLFFLFFLLSGCTKKIKENTVVKEEIVITKKEEIIASPQSNKTLNLSIRLPKTFNPLLNEDETVDNMMKLIFENLISLDEFQKPIPNLLESYEFSTDGKSIKCILKENLKWHDGEIITANDIGFSIDIIKSAQEASIYKESSKHITSYDISSSNVIKINFNKSYLGNIYLLNFPIIPKHHYENNLNNKIILGSGAYKFLDSPNLKEINLTKNTDFFKQEALIDFIKILIVTDFESDMNSFLQKVIDVIDTHIVDWGKFDGGKAINISTYTTNNYDFIGFNYKNPVFSEMNIKKAIAHLIDKEYIVKSVYLDYATAATVPINPNSWLYENAIAEYNFDPKLSEQLVIDSGFKLNEKGTYYKEITGADHFLDLKILVNSENIERKNISLMLKENLNKIGIKSEIVELPFDEYNEKILKKDFDIIVGGYNLSIIPDLTFLFSSESIDIGTNIFSYRNEIMDTKLYNVSISHNQNALIDSISDLQLYIAEELPIISLVYRESALLTDTKIYGDIKPTVENIFNNINEWYIFEK